MEKHMAAKEKNYDLRELLKPYANKWVALSSDRRRIIEKGDELKEVAAKTKSKDVIFLKVFPADSFYIPQNTQV